MSDTLADLASWLSSEFLTRDHDNHLLFPTDFPYEFASSESESDDDDLAAFTPSVSFKNPYSLHLKKRVFSGSPESTLNWVVSGPAQVRSSPATPFVQPEENAWDLIYAAAGQVARMKMRMNNVNDDVYGNRGLLGAPRPPYHPHCAIWGAQNQEFIRQQQIRRRVTNHVGGGGCGVGRPVGFRQSAWPVENQRRQQPSNGFVVKPDLGLGTPVVKRECTGTGVFLPRRYCNDPPESKRIPACSARVAQSFNKNMDPMITQAQANIHGGYGPLSGAGRMMVGHQRRNNSNVGVPVPERPMEVVLPQEWTY